MTGIKRQLIPAVVSMVVLTLALGIIYPLLITGIGQLAFPGTPNAQKTHPAPRGRHARGGLGPGHLAGERLDPGTPDRRGPSPLAGDREQTDLEVHGRTGPRIL